MIRVADRRTAGAQASKKKKASAQKTSTKASTKTSTKASKASSKQASKAPLSKERALLAAVALADREGLAALSMRRLADALSVEAMSLYHHVPSKDAILDGMVDLVFAEVEAPRTDLPWQEALRRRCGSLRAMLLRHRWAIHVVESRTQPGVATLAHHDAMVGCFLDAGFSIGLAAHAYAIVDAYVYGFTHTELVLPFEREEDAHVVAAEMATQMPPGVFPHLERLTREVVMRPGYRYSASFTVGLELVIDGLARAHAAEAAVVVAGEG